MINRYAIEKYIRPRKGTYHNVWYSYGIDFGECFDEPHALILGNVVANSEKVPCYAAQQREQSPKDLEFNSQTFASETYGDCDQQPNTDGHPTDLVPRGHGGPSPDAGTKGGSKRTGDDRQGKVLFLS